MCAIYRFILFITKCTRNKYKNRCPKYALIDGNREAPVLQYKNGIIDPMKLTWSRIKKAGESCNVIETYKSALIAD